LALGRGQKITPEPSPKNSLFFPSRQEKRETRGESKIPRKNQKNSRTHQAASDEGKAYFLEEDKQSRGGRKGKAPLLCFALNGRQSFSNRRRFQCERNKERGVDEGKEKKKKAVKAEFG